MNYYKVDTKNQDLINLVILLTHSFTAGTAKNYNTFFCRQDPKSTLTIIIIVISPVTFLCIL